MKRWMSGLLSVIAMPVLGAGLLSCKNNGTTVEPEEQVQQLPLGRSDLEEKRTAQEIVPGVTYTVIERGVLSSQDVYTVDVAFRTDRAAAESLVTQLQAGGYEAR